MTQYSQKLIDILEDILTKIPQVEDTWRQLGDEGGFEDTVLYESLITEIITILIHIYGEDHPIYQKAVKATHAQFSSPLDTIKGILLGTKENIIHGLLDDLTNKITADIEVDFLQSAISLFEQGHKDPASVLACSVLEDSLKRFAEKHGQSELRQQKLSIVAQKLLEGKNISKTTHASLLSFKDLRNAALHAQWEHVCENDLKRLFTFLPIFIEQYGV